MTFGPTARLPFLRAGWLTAVPCRWGALVVPLLLWSWSSNGSLTASAQSTSEWPVHARGLGRLTVGMTLDEARQVPGIQLTEQGPPPVPADYCTYFSVRLAGHECRMRVKMNRVNRIEVTSLGFRAATGVAVGDSIERVKTVYGKSLSIEPHHYLWVQGVVLMVAGPYDIEGEAYGIAFVASPAKGVTGIWAGRYDEIRESEGCL